MFRRWAVVHKHDSSPVDGLVFIHKLKAQDNLKLMPSPEKHKVIQVMIAPELST